jgi:hypothetical protein
VLSCFLSGYCLRKDKYGFYQKLANLRLPEQLGFVHGLFIKFAFFSFFVCKIRKEVRQKGLHIVEFKVRTALFRKKHREEDSSSQKVL